MKKYIGVLAFGAITCVSVISCKKETSSPSSNIAQVETLHFSKIRQASGMSDSTLVDVTIKGSEVEGKMLWLPDGKDSKFGILKGVKNGNGDINLQFENFQEGVKKTDSMIVTLDSNQMIIKDFWEGNSENNKKIPAPYFKDTLQKSSTEVFSESWKRRFKSIFNQ